MLCWGGSHANLPFLKHFRPLARPLDLQSEKRSTYPLGIPLKEIEGDGKILPVLLLLF